MKTVIGRANVYFTLWNVSDPYKVYTSPTSFYEKVDYWYLQNLSMNLDAAKAKLEGQDFEVDFDLRGSHSYSKRLDGGKLTNTASESQFAFGKYEGTEINLCSDTWQLERLVDDFNNMWPLGVEALDSQKEYQRLVTRRAAIARRRLLDLGIYVRYPVKFDKWNAEIQEYVEFKRSCTYVKNAEFLKAKAKKDQTFDHYFSPGEKVTLKLKEIESFRFEQTFGYRTQWTYIVTYLDIEGRGFKYIGSSPPSFIGMEEFTAIKGTVKHDEYRGVKETKLQRIALAK